MRGEVKAAKRRRCEFVQQICSLEVQFELRTTELKADGSSADRSSADGSSADGSSADGSSADDQTQTEDEGRMDSSVLISERLNV